MRYVYSDTFKHTITSVYGDHGVKWLNQLPNIIEQCKEQWHLTDLKPYTNLTYNYVLSGMMNNIPIVLKLSCDHKSMEQEAQALKLFNGNGCVKLLDQNLEEGALLLERADPGQPLSSLFPDKDTEVIKNVYTVMQRLHSVKLDQNIYQRFPDLKTITRALFEVDAGPIPQGLLYQAREYAKELLSSQEKMFLLHGDLHQDNILSDNEVGWLTIDPKGVIGEQAYEMACSVYNPIEKLPQYAQAKELISARIDQFAELSGVSKTKIGRWAFVRAILGACWNIQDNLSPENFIHCAQLIRKSSTKTN